MRVVLAGRCPSMRVSRKELLRERVRAGESQSDAGETETDTDITAVCMERHFFARSGALGHAAGGGTAVSVSQCDPFRTVPIILL